MTRLAMENCDFLVSIPMRSVNSLNATPPPPFLLARRCASPDDLYENHGIEIKGWI